MCRVPKVLYTLIAHYLDLDPADAAKLSSKAIKNWWVYHYPDYWEKALRTHFAPTHYLHLLPDRTSLKNVEDRVAYFDASAALLTTCYQRDYAGLSPIKRRFIYAVKTGNLKAVKAFSWEKIGKVHLDRKSVV